MRHAARGEERTRQPYEAGDTSRRAALDSGGGPRQGPAARLVVGFDHDEASQSALAAAVDLAGRLHARLIVVHIVDLGDYPINVDAPNWEESARENLADERRLVAEALQDHEFGWSYGAWFGSPAGTLIQVADAEDALMIIVGRHGHGLSEGLRRLIDGSVSRQLAMSCHRPVLVVAST
jgi:nucleotide-binding universal stress UspA family protein